MSTTTATPLDFLNIQITAVDEETQAVIGIWKAYNENIERPISSGTFVRALNEEDQPHEIAYLRTRGGWLCSIPTMRAMGRYIAKALDGLSGREVDLREPITIDMDNVVTGKYVRPLPTPKWMQ